MQPGRSSRRPANRGPRSPPPMRVRPLPRAFDLWWTALLLLQRSEAAPAAHSCYYFIVHVSHCKPGAPAGGSAYDSCLACAKQHSSQEPGCTEKLMEDACHGTLPGPPRPPPPPAAQGDLELTLLTSAAAEKGAVCRTNSRKSIASKHDCGWSTVGANVSWRFERSH